MNINRALLTSGMASRFELFLDPDGAHALGGAVQPAGWHRKYEAFCLRNLGTMAGQWAVAPSSSR